MKNVIKFTARTSVFREFLSVIGIILGVGILCFTATRPASAERLPASKVLEPTQLTPVNVVNEQGNLVPAVVIVLRNSCKIPQVEQVSNVANYPLSLDLAQGDCLIALQPQRFVATTKDFHPYPLFQPFGATGNIAYVIVTTNLVVAPNGDIIFDKVQQPGTAHTLVTHATSPLILYNLLISLEWDAVQNGDLEPMAQASAAFSNSLYDATNGQMALGHVSIEAGAQHWRDADIQVMAANDVWPNADVGGIESQPLRLGKNVVLTPGHLRVGRAWDGNSPSQGAWNEPEGWLTLLHEFGHYGLGLYDEYIGLAPDGDNFSSYCTMPPTAPSYASNWASLMSYQYTANEFALRKDTDPMQWTAQCRRTIQFQMYNLSDWETLALRFNRLADTTSSNAWQLQLPIGGANPGPSQTPPGITSIEKYQTPNAPAPIQLLVSRPLNSNIGDLQIYQFAAANRVNAPKLVSQGTITRTDKIELLGTYAGDSLVIVDPEGVAFKRIIVPGGSSLATTLSTPGWSPNVSFIASASRQITLTVRSPIVLTGLTGFVYERGSKNQPLNLSFSAEGAASQATFTAPIANFAGYVHLLASGGRETILSFALTDGSPSAHDTAHAPRADVSIARVGIAAQGPTIVWDARGQAVPQNQRVISNRVGFYTAPRNSPVAKHAQFEENLQSIWLRVNPNTLPSGRSSCLSLNNWQETNTDWKPLNNVNGIRTDFFSAPITNTGTYALLRPSAGCMFKRVDAPEPIVGQLVTFTIGFDNADAPFTNNLTVSDVLAPALKPISVQATSGQASFQGQTMTWAGSLAKDDILIITMTAEIRAGTLPNTVIPNKAEAKIQNVIVDSAQADFRTCYPYDLDCNGSIGVLDLVQAASAWNAELVSGLTSARYDFDRDGVVSLADIQAVAARWGWTWP